MNKHQNYRLSWHGASVLIAGPILLLVLCGLICTLQYKDVADIQCMLGIAFAIFSAWLILAFYFRFKGLCLAETKIVLKHMGIGIGLIAVASILTWVSYEFINLPFLGQMHYLIPTGLFFYGMFIIARAMNPNEPIPGYTPEPTRSAAQTPPARGNF